MQGAHAPSPDSLRELTSLVVPDVSGGCADEAVHTVCLEELGHVQAHKHFLVVEELPAQPCCASIHACKQTRQLSLCADVRRHSTTRGQASRCVPCESASGLGLTDTSRSKEKEATCEQHQRVHTRYTHMIIAPTLLS